MFLNVLFSINIAVSSELDLKIRLLVECFYPILQKKTVKTLKQPPNQHLTVSFFFQHKTNWLTICHFRQTKHFPRVKESLTGGLYRIEL